MSGRKRAAVLISGRGSNMDALVAAAADPSYPVEIVGVFSNRDDARGLEIARSRGIRAVAVPHRDHATREAHEAALEAALAGVKPDIVCLAGYMRLLTPGFVARWSGRMINIHPSLLPAFPGLQTHRRALETGVMIHGCTVHFVTATMDEGPIIAQAAVSVLPGDDEDRLGARVLAAEHKLYPMALAMVARGDAAMRGGTTVFATAAVDTAPEMMLSPAPVRAAQPESGDADLEHLARFTP